jgi:hypothetical protein
MMGTIFSSFIPAAPPPLKDRYQLLEEESCGAQYHFDSYKHELRRVCGKFAKCH